MDKTQRSKRGKSHVRNEAGTEETAMNEIEKDHIMVYYRFGILHDKRTVNRSVITALIVLTLPLFR